MDKKDLKNMFPSLKGKWEDKGYYKKLEGLFEPISEGLTKYGRRLQIQGAEKLQPFHNFLADTDVPITTQQAVRVADAYKKLGGNPVDINNPEALYGEGDVANLSRKFPESP